MSNNASRTGRPPDDGGEDTAGLHPARWERYTTQADRRGGSGVLCLTTSGERRRLIGTWLQSGAALTSLLAEPTTQDVGHHGRPYWLLCGMRVGSHGQRALGRCMGLFPRHPLTSPAPPSPLRRLPAPVCSLLPASPVYSCSSGVIWKAFFCTAGSCGAGLRGRQRTHLTPSRRRRARAS
jgi:hypothetical protein